MRLVQDGAEKVDHSRTERSVASCLVRRLSVKSEWG